MARIQETVVIARPVNEVFAFVANARDWPRWHSTMLEAEQTSPGEVGVGTTFQGVNREMGIRMVWTSKATEYEPGQKWGETITSGAMLMQASIMFEPLGAGTMLKMQYDMSVGGPLRLLAPVVTANMRGQMKGNLHRLKSILEGRAP
jgi:uncharacterized membrane protein